MKFKNLLFALLAVIAAATWTACQKTTVAEDAKTFTDMQTGVRDAVWFENVTPPATVDGHQLSQAQLYGPDTGKDTIKIRTTGLTAVTYLEHNGTVLDTDSLLATGFIQNDSFFVVPTTAAFRLGVTPGNWTVKVEY